MKSMALLLMAMSLSGCSNRAIYENFRINQREECAKGPPSQYEECMKQTRQTYDEYERERRRALDE